MEREGRPSSRGVLSHQWATKYRAVLQLFGLLVVGLAPEYPRVISPSPVMQVFAAHAHAAIARERKKAQPRQVPGIPADSRWRPRSRAAPAGRPSSDPLKTEYRPAGRPAGGLDDVHDSTPRN